MSLSPRAARCLSLSEASNLRLACSDSRESFFAGNRSRIGVPELATVTPWYRAGRKPLVQLIEPPAGNPRGSGITT
jgi:hypothetical protein